MYNISKIAKHFYYGRGGGSEGGVDTTADGKQAFLVVGDSNADGRGNTIPVVAADTLYLSDGSAITEITTQSVTNNDPTKGSIWQQFATDYKASQSKKTVLVNGAWGGAEIFPDGDADINWYTTGTLYGLAKTKAESTLTLLGLTKLKGIFINVGINDVRGGVSAANIETGIDSLLDRLTTDFPDTPILVYQVGRTESAIISSALCHIRNYWVTKAEELANVHIIGNAMALYGAGQYNVDNLHYSQDGCNNLGSMAARWFANSTYTNKWARGLISSHFDELSTVRKTLINTFITNIYDRGDYFKLEHLSVYKTTTQNNIFNDWSFLGFSADSGSTFVANSHVATNGGNNSHIVGHAPALYRRATSTDVVSGVKLKTNSNTPGTLAILFGSGAATLNDLNYVRDSSIGVQFAVNDETATSGTEFSLASGNLYSNARNGTSKYLLKNKVVDVSATVASTGATSNITHVGAFNNNGTIDFHFPGEYEYSFCAKYSDFDFDSFYDDIETLIANW